MGNSENTNKIKLFQGGAKTATGFSSMLNDENDRMDPQEFASLLNAYDSSFRHISEGEVVKGTVLKVTGNEVVIDVGYKSEGAIQVEEFLDETGAGERCPREGVDDGVREDEDDPRRGRTGVAFGTVLPYLTGGLAVGDIEARSSLGSSTTTRAGWTVGTGVEWAVVGPWTAKVEYLTPLSVSFAASQSMNFSRAKIDAAATA